MLQKCQQPFSFPGLVSSTYANILRICWGLLTPRLTFSNVQNLEVSSVDICSCVNICIYICNCICRTWRAVSATQRASSAPPPVPPPSISLNSSHKANLFGELGDVNVNISSLFNLVNLPTALVGRVILMLMLIPPLYLISLDSFFRHQAIVYFGGDTPALARYVDNLHHHLIISLKSLS